jgi:hypothetical protein
MVKLESKSHPEAELYGEAAKPVMRPGHEMGSSSNGKTKSLIVSP